MNKARKARKLCLASASSHLMQHACTDRDRTQLPAWHPAPLLEAALSSNQ